MKKRKKEKILRKGEKIKQIFKYRKTLESTVQKKMTLMM